MNRAQKRDIVARKPKGRNTIVGRCVGCKAEIMAKAVGLGGAIQLNAPGKYLCCICEGGTYGG